MVCRIDRYIVGMSNFLLHFVTFFMWGDILGNPIKTLFSFGGFIGALSLRSMCVNAVISSFDRIGPRGSGNAQCYNAT